jgi:hypothetical protein
MIAYGLPFLRVEVVWYFAYFCKGAIGIPSVVRGSRQMDHIVWTCLLSVKTEEILRGHAQMPQVSWNNDDSNMVPYIPTSASLLVGIHCIDHELPVFPKNVLGAFIFTHWALRFITLWLWLLHSHGLPMAHRNRGLPFLIAWWFSMAMLNNQMVYNIINALSYYVIVSPDTQTLRKLQMSP